MQFCRRPLLLPLAIVYCPDQAQFIWNEPVLSITMHISEHIKIINPVMFFFYKLLAMVLRKSVSETVIPGALVSW